MKNNWTSTKICEMKVKKKSQKMNEIFTTEDLWKMIKLFALLFFLITMGFLNATPCYHTLEILEMNKEEVVIRFTGPSLTWVCRTNSCGSINYNNVLYCRDCGAYRYD